jgi:hypothetical protein
MNAFAWLRAPLPAGSLRPGILAACLALAAQWTSGQETAWSQIADHMLKDHLAVGLRASDFSLETTTKRVYDADGKFVHGFLGSIDRLEEEQSYAPAIYVRWNFNSYINAEFGREHMEVRTWTHAKDGHSDGAFDLSGWILALNGRYANATRFAPYAGIGWAFLDAKFDAEPFWEFGFETPAEYASWRATGSPPWSGIRQTIAADNEPGLLFQMGCDIVLKDHLRLDLAARHIAMDVDTRYHFPDGREDVLATFPMDSWAFVAGLHYAF